MNWYKKAQQNPEVFYLDNFLILDAEKLATGANLHLLRKLVINYQLSTTKLNNKQYRTIEEKKELINMRNNSEQQIKNIIYPIKKKKRL